MAKFATINEASSSAPILSLLESPAYFTDFKLSGAVMQIFEKTVEPLTILLNMINPQAPEIMVFNTLSATEVGDNLADSIQPAETFTGSGSGKSKVWQTAYRTFNAGSATGGTAGIGGVVDPLQVQSMTLAGLIDRLQDAGEVKQIVITQVAGAVPEMVRVFTLSDLSAFTLTSGLVGNLVLDMPEVNAQPSNGLIYG